MSPTESFLELLSRKGGIPPTKSSLSTEPFYNNELIESLTY
jgi:hypothetical protein